MADPIRFIRKNGRIIPIGARATSAGRVGTTIAKGVLIAGAAKTVHSKYKEIKKPGSDIKVNRGLDALGLGLSVASGVVGAATFSGGPKKFFTGVAASHGLDAAGIAANVASVAGKGNGKERLKQAGKQEARNFLIGNVVFGAGLFATKANRQVLGNYAQRIVALGKKALRRA